MKIDFTPVYRSKTLRGLSREIRADLSSLFNLGDSSFAVYSIGTESGKREYRKIHENDGDYTKEEIEDNISGFGPGGKRAQTIYLGGILGDSEYAVFVAGEDIEKILPKVIGEELTHGEHATRHLEMDIFRRDWIKALEDYIAKFPEQASEFISEIGYRFISQKFPEGVLENDTYENDVPPVCVDGPEYVAAKQIAGQLISKEGFDRSSEIFHAKNQGEVWEIVNGIFIPNVKFKYNPKSPKAGKAPKIIKSVYEKFRETGLKIGVSLYGPSENEN
ncbi:MAG: hypothetical protein JW754_04255 [Candidatus Aenigmarchaeota archaeon]|nr:hypothetical protein [Candidatus Aenigmarchaeota archaeon]